MWGSDLRYALRSLRSMPLFTTVAVLTLALGLGAAALVITVIVTILWRPLPYANPDALALLWSRWTGFEKTWLSVAEVYDYRQQSQTFEEIAVWQPDAVNVTGGGAAERIASGQVTANLFAVLGVEPVLGRTFTADEDAPDRRDTVVIGESLWSRRYGRDPAIVGSSIQVDGVGRTVVGVMPASFHLPLDFQGAQPSELWTPIGLVFTNDSEARDSHSYFAIGRLKAGQSSAAASSELGAIAARMNAAGLYPPAMRFDAFAVGLADEVFGRVRPVLLLLGLTASLLLLITCANIVNLQLTRAEGARRDVAIRTTLGASLGALFRQQLAEAFVLVTVGAGSALLLASFAVRVLTTFASAGVPRLAETRLDGSSIAATAVIALVVAIVLATVPFLHGRSGRLSETLKAGSHGSAGVVRRRFRQGMVVVQLALAFVLVVCAGLAIRTLWALQRIDVGFNPDHVLTAELSVPTESYPQPADVVAYYERVLARVRALPGVEYAGLVRSLPLASEIGDWGLAVEGYRPPAGQSTPGDWQVASDGYFEAMGERLVRGRWFESRDRSDAAEVAVVNETMGRTYWPGTDPIGGRFRMGSDAARPWITVVGIVRDVRHNGITGAVKPKFYRPHAQFANVTGFAPTAMTLVLRTSVAPSSLGATVRSAIAELDANVPMSRVRTMDEVMAAAVAAPRLAGALMGGFAVVALAVAAIGLYGVLAYLVSRRTRELGIRLALGAQPSTLRAQIVGEGLRLALAGVGAGLVGAALAARAMSGLLYGVVPFDLLTFTLVPTVLLAVALVASDAPARRATLIDPLRALRAE